MDHYQEIINILIDAYAEELEQTKLSVKDMIKEYWMSVAEEMEQSPAKHITFGDFGRLDWSLDSYLRYYFAGRSPLAKFNCEKYLNNINYPKESEERLTEQTVLIFNKHPKNYVTNLKKRRFPASGKKDSNSNALSTDNEQWLNGY